MGAVDHSAAAWKSESAGVGPSDAVHRAALHGAVHATVRRLFILAPPPPHACTLSAFVCAHPPPFLSLSLSLSLSANVHTHTPTPHTYNISFDDAEPDELTTEYISLVVLTRSNRISERILSALQSAFPTSVRITTDDDLVLSAIEQRIIEHQVCSPCLEL